MVQEVCPVEIIFGVLIGFKIGFKNWLKSRFLLSVDRFFGLRVEVLKYLIWFVAYLPQGSTGGIYCFHGLSS